MLGFKSMRTAYTTMKGIEVMRALRKGQATAFYCGHALGDVYLVLEKKHHSHRKLRLIFLFATVPFADNGSYYIARPHVYLQNY